MSRIIQMPREVHIGPDVLSNIGDICKGLHLYDEAIVVSGNHTFGIAGKDVVDSLEGADFSVDSVMEFTHSGSCCISFPSNIVISLGFTLRRNKNPKVDFHSFPYSNHGQ